jgi:site-specific DNA-methyltransferase (adenine-specific)
MTPYYQDDLVVIHHGDVLRVMSGLPTGSVDTVLMDPPYSSGTRPEASKTVRAKSMLRSDREWFGTDSLTTNGFTWLMREVAVESHRVLRTGGHLFCFIDWRMLPTLSGAIESADLRPMSLVVWDKGHFGMGAHFRNQHELVLHFAKGDPTEAQRHDVGNVIRQRTVFDAEHPTQKPTALLGVLLSVVTPKGGTVLDPFAGSGSTLIAAADLGMRAIGVEREEAYCAMVQRRRQQSVLGLEAA